MLERAALHPSCFPDRLDRFSVRGPCPRLSLSALRVPRTQPRNLTHRPFTPACFRHLPDRIVLSLPYPRKLKQQAIEVPCTRYQNPRLAASRGGFDCCNNGNEMF